MLIASFGLVLALGASAASAPITTIIAAGNIVTAHILYGDRAEIGTPGRDAIRVFASIAAYDYWYRFDDGGSCADECLRPVYATLRRAGTMELISVGERVRVLAKLHDPQDPKYHVCRIDLRGRTRYVLCNALADVP